MRDFSVVVAADLAGGIAKNADLPWRLPGDLAWFKQLTSTPPEAGLRNTVFMGRKTWESIPSRFRPLPGRFNIVITRQDNYSVPEGVGVAKTVEDAIDKADSGHIFCVGGGEIYRLAVAMEQCKHVYLTKVESTFECDTFFPDVSHAFQVRETQGPYSDNKLEYNILTLERVLENER